MQNQTPLPKPTDAEQPSGKGLDAMICSPSSDDLPTPQPSGAWDRSDYVRQYARLAKDFEQAEESRKVNAALYERTLSERDEARKIAAELRDLVPWSESEPWNFTWENSVIEQPIPRND